MSRTRLLLQVEFLAPWAQGRHGLQMWASLWQLRAADLRPTWESVPQP